MSYIGIQGFHRSGETGGSSAGEGRGLAILWAERGGPHLYSQNLDTWISEFEGSFVYLENLRPAKAT